MSRSVRTWSLYCLTGVLLIVITYAIGTRFRFGRNPADVARRRANATQFDHPILKIFQKAAAPAKMARVARILAFGDSLTEGFCEDGMTMHPYAIQLRQLLGSAIHVHEAGVSGETATAMDERLQGLIDKEKEKGTPFTHVLIMGGTNDLAWGVDSAYLVKVLGNLHRIAHDAGCKTLALSIPPASFPSPSRDKANVLLEEWAKAQPNTKFLNVGSFIPYDDDHKKFWDDNLHFSAAGYNYLGELIHEAIKDEDFLTPL